MDERDLIKTTVVIAVWDRYVAFLEATLQSLARQDVAAKVLVVDNASTPPVPSAEYAQVVRLPARLTLGAARNAGLARVGTPYAIFWDADDQMLPGALEILQDQLEKHPEFVAFGMGITEIPSGERHRWPRRYLPRLARLGGAFSLMETIWSMFPTTGATIVRTDAARAGGGFADADSGEDWCLGVSLALRGRIGWSEQRGRLYRQDPDSMWARHLTLAHQRRHAEAVRHRLRSDPAAPGWMRRGLPVIGLAQHVALAVHLGVAARRALRQRSG